MVVGYADQKSRTRLYSVGLAVQRVARGPVGVFERVLAGVFAAGGILIGKYVIDIHELNDLIHQHPGTGQVSVGYFDGQYISFWVHHLGTVLRGNLYWLWIILAAAGAFRVSGGNAVLGMGRRRS